MTRVAIVADMEGASGLRDPFDILAFSRSYWTRGRAVMTADVAAAARGLLEAGADEVTIRDGHASGNPATNMLPELLPPGARIERGTNAELAALGLEGVLHVGFHPRAGIAGFVAHTHVPGLRLRVDGELVGENHNAGWAAGAPLLGIVGADAHRRTLGSLSGVPYLDVQRTDAVDAVEPVYATPEEADEAIAAFAADALRGGGMRLAPPRDFLLEASLPCDDAGAASLEAAGWQRLSDTEFAATCREWSETPALIGPAMGASFAAWAPAFFTHELTSAEALERVHDDPPLVRGREMFAEWLRADHPEWLSGSGR